MVWRGIPIYNLLFGLIVLSASGNGMLQDISKMFVVTVIDTANADIVRDALTLLTSIRLNGGRLNDALIAVAVTIQESSAVINEQHLFTRLQNLNVTIHYIEPVAQGVPKTMNKYLAFELFNPISHDYFLWLDADIVVFRDPTSFLQKHSQREGIKCVPEFYNYMVRYPQVNESLAFRNPSLPSFLLLDDVVAPHGLCNTGTSFNILSYPMPSHHITSHHSPSRLTFHQ